MYPYADMANQTRNLGSVSIVQRNGQVVKRVVHSANAAKVRLPVVSSRSDPVVKSTANSAGLKAAVAQFVNVGTFDHKKSAQTAAQRIKRMGLPVRIDKYTWWGKTYRMVLVGPFSADASRVLSKLALLDIETLFCAKRFRFEYFKKGAPDGAPFFVSCRRSLEGVANPRPATRVW